MTQFKNQKGFAAIEIVFVVMIIAILSGVALPKMSQMIELANLNYETKRFVSEFYFAKSLSRSSQIEPIIFSGVVNGGKPISFSVASRSYQITSSGNPVGEKYTLPKNFKISKNLPSVLVFSNGKNSDSGTYTITSPKNFSLYVIKNTQDRIRISRTPANN